MNLQHPSLLIDFYRFYLKSISHGRSDTFYRTVTGMINQIIRILYPTIRNLSGG